MLRLHSAGASVAVAMLLGCSGGSSGPSDAGADAGQAPGIPEGACAAGFTPDGSGGCVATVPSTPCGAGLMAVPGETACREVMPCGAAPWGDIPVDADTE